MDKNEQLLRLLEATAGFQQQIARILEAKSREADAVTRWIVASLREPRMQPEDQLQASHEVHEQVLEWIEGITKMENSLGEGLKIILKSEDGEAGGGESMFPGSFFGLGEDASG